jgi:arsenate reductase
MQEIGLDISEYRSKSADEVEGPVDAVITLCAEETCPIWLEEAIRLHWPLSDPAVVQGSEEEQTDAYRAARDELSRRLGVLFGA